jgi:hypothetical protein
MFQKTNILHGYFEDTLQKHHGASQGRGNYNQELKSYLSEPLELADCNVLHFWEKHCKKYPKLCILAKQHLILPASSTASERVVSCLNLIATPKRSRLTERNIENLVFLRSLDISVWKKLMVSFLA